MTKTQRHELADLFAFLVAHEPKIHYREVRPMQSAAIATRAELEHAIARPEGITVDCSEFVTLCFHVVGAKSPSGPEFGWRFGNTQTMLDHLPHYTNPALAKTGAIVIFGADLPLSRQHAAMVWVPGRDPIICSHGTERGPVRTPLSDEQTGHAGSTVFLNVSRL